MKISLTRRLGAVLLAAGLALGGAGARPAEASSLLLSCAGGTGAIEAMENSYIADPYVGPCWAHLGHHTYDLGGAFALGAISGRVFTVEIQLSPPTEQITPFVAPITVERSLDGITWETVATIPYPMLLNATQVLPLRQGIDFTADGLGAVARYVRVRQPRSAAQGLSGYLDSSRMTVDATAATAAPRPAPSGSLGCETATMERFFALEHPCWFGGVNRYDAASMFHTYPLGDGRTLDRVSGRMSFLPWRSDDYTQRGGSRTVITGYVQISTDGVAWTTLGSATGLYGEDIPFDFGGLGGVSARYVRIAAERHTGYRSHPALKHLRGMVLSSAVDLS